MEVKEAEEDGKTKGGVKVKKKDGGRETEK